MGNELLQQVRVVDPSTQTDRVADVLIRDGIIAAVETKILDLPAQTKILKGADWVVGPGLVDLYSHSGEPGFEARETLDSLVKAAVAGGFTRLTILPDTQPALDHPGGWERLHSRLSPLPLRLQGWGALTLGTQGEAMTDLMELASLEGIVGFSDGYPLSNLVLVRRLLEYLRPLEKPIALWPCNQDLTGGGVLREGFAALRFGLPGTPAIAETTALAALLEVVAATGTPVHIMHVSTARSVELLEAAKAKGLPITASTDWMHLLWNETAVASYDPNLRLDPPLGSPADQQALIWGVRSGVIDGIAIDHTPYTYEEKTVAFAEAPPGVIGLELALPLLWQRFVATQQWSALELWSALSLKPARCLQQQLLAIAAGQPAELVLFDPHWGWTVTTQTLKSRSRNTPWFGQELTGRVVKTWCP